MPVIRVFEPALCCNTGVCGPQLDQELVDFTAAVSELKTRGVDIERANLASEPSQFAHNPVVVNFLRTAGSEGLPTDAGRRCDGPDRTSSPTGGTRALCRSD